MGLDITLYFDVDVGRSNGEKHRLEVYDANITHNLTEMAGEAGIYEPVWRPEENQITEASQLIPILEQGIKKMKDDPAHYKQFDSPNGWGVYEDFVPWLERYLDACREYPKAAIYVSR